MSAREAQREGLKARWILLYVIVWFWALTTTYGVVYFYNVIIPPPATTLLKLSACWGKNSVKSPADPDTAEHKQWSSGLGNTRSAHGHTTAHKLRTAQLL